MPDTPHRYPTSPLLDRPALLAALRARVERLERPGGAGQEAAAAVPVCDGIPLPGNGLARAGVHEVLAADSGAATGFCALLLGRTGGTVLWIAHDGGGPPDAWPPGLTRFGRGRCGAAAAKARSPVA